MLPIVFVSLDLFTAPGGRARFLNMLTPDCRFPGEADLSSVFCYCSKEIIDECRFVSLLRSRGSSAHSIIYVGGGLGGRLHGLSARVF